MVAALTIFFVLADHFGYFLLQQETEPSAPPGNVSMKVPPEELMKGLQLLPFAEATYEVTPWGEYETMAGEWVKWKICIDAL